MSLPSNVLVFIDIQNCPFRIDCEFIFKSNLDGCLTIRYITTGFPKSNFTSSNNTKEDGYTGVTYYPKNRKWVCRVSSSLLDKKRCVGLFDSKEEAWEQYKIVKASRIKEAALKYKDIIDERAFNNLINWRI